MDFCLEGKALVSSHKAQKKLIFNLMFQAVLSEQTHNQNTKLKLFNSYSRIAVHLSDQDMRPYLCGYKSEAMPALPWPALFKGRYLMPAQGSGQHRFIIFLLAADGILWSVT